jgi:hypothetical protein
LVAIEWCRNLSNWIQVKTLIADNLQMNSIGSTASPTLVTAENSGLNAIATASQRLNDDARQIANPNSSDVTAPLMDLNQALVLAEAGANVISAENKILGTLLDAFA